MALNVEPTTAVAASAETTPSMERHSEQPAELADAGPAFESTAQEERADASASPVETTASQWREAHWSTRAASRDQTVATHSASVAQGGRAEPAPVQPRWTTASRSVLGPVRYARRTVSAYSTPAATDDQSSPERTPAMAQEVHSPAPTPTAQTQRRTPRRQSWRATRGLPSTAASTAGSASRSLRRHRSSTRLALVRAAPASSPPQRLEQRGQPGRERPQRRRARTLLQATARGQRGSPRRKPSIARERPPSTPCLGRRERPNDIPDTKRSRPSLPLARRCG